MAGGGVAAAVIAVVAVVVIVAVSGNDPGPTPPPIAMVDSAGLDSILLTADEIHSIVGRSDLSSTEVIRQMDDTSLTMSNPNCSGILGTAIKSVYADSGYTSVRDQAFTLEDPRVWIAQTAVLFPSADQAGQFMSTSADKWSRCVGETVSIAVENGDERWTFGELTQSDSQVVQGATAEAAGGYACQHVIRAVLNVVIEAAACHEHVTDEANRIAETMVANVPA